MEKREDIIRRLYIEGVSIKDIMEQAQCAERTVAKWVERLGLERRGSGPRLKTDRNDEIVRKYISENQSINSLAREFDVSSTRVRKILQGRDIPLRGHADGIMRYVVKIPPWVPECLALEYQEITLTVDEFAAARHVRALKREMERPEI